MSISRRMFREENQTPLPLPDKSTFQTGDFLWPKKPGAYVPYKYNTNQSARLDEKGWYAERDAFVRRLSRDPRFFKPEDIQNLREMSYREFYARYAGDQKPGVPGQYSSGGGVYVGHVAILDVDQNGNPWVTEALLDRGVVRSTYTQWLASRPGEIVWHGRIRDLSAQDRSKVALESKKYLGKPYDFWNFNLDDDHAFYCSKLVWLSINRSLHFPIDGNPNPRRVFWFSPKQLLYAKTITRLHDPGPYANCS